ncbi:MAG: hypothetical protein V7K77_04265 [Nostoc sp.]|uniref:hypothetical protein n=1 Tax=Nostoc sp. TaxID=1180 RepID=UPI002FFD571A
MTNTSLRDAPRSLLPRRGTTTQFDCAHRKLSDHANDYAVVESSTSPNEDATRTLNYREVETQYK